MNTSPPIKITMKIKSKILRLGRLVLVTHTLHA
jgi:hypothetical protein